MYKVAGLLSILKGDTEPAPLEDLVKHIPNPFKICRQVQVLLRLRRARVILVFDGRRYPPKRMTNLSRQSIHSQAVEDLERFKVAKRVAELGLQSEDEAEYLKK